MFNRLLSSQYYCGLDLGSQKIKASLVRAADPQNLDLLAVVEQETAGFKEGSVSDLGALSDCIHKVLQHLSKKTNQKIKSIYLGLGGDIFNYRRSQATIPLVERGSKVISDQDVRRVNHQARLLGAQLDEDVVHGFSINYKVDDANIALNPVGLYGRKLAVDQLLVLGNAMRLRNIVKAVNHAGYDVVKTAFNSYSAAEVSLDEDDRKKGCLLIDIGSHATHVLIFADDVLKSVQYIDSAGHFITQTIAHRLKLSFSMAEEIKKSYSGPIDNAKNSDEEILVKRDQGYVPVKRKEVCAAVDDAVQMIIEGIYKAVLNSGYHQHVNAGITVVGGGVMLPGLIEKLEQLMSMPVKTGVLTQGLQNSAIYAGCVGLAQGACIESLRYSIASKTPQTWSDVMVKKVRELYHEYF